MVTQPKQFSKLFRRMAPISQTVHLKTSLQSNWRLIWVSIRLKMRPALLLYFQMARWVLVSCPQELKFNSLY
jgi:hypothetical protein